MPRLIFLLFLLGTSVGMTRSQPFAYARDVSVTHIVATPVALDPEGGRRGVGALRYVSGHVLTSADPRFGGISSMALVPAGFVGLSDGGTVMSMTGMSMTRGRPTALRLMPLPAGPGVGTAKRDRDSEALVRGPGGQWWVAFERHNAVWRYTPDFRFVVAHRAPPEMSVWSANSGAEAMVRLDDGRFLVFSEGSGRVPGSSDALIFDRDPTDAKAHASRLSYRIPAGFSVTDAALLGDGRLMTLHRSLSLGDGIAASVGIVDIKAFVPGAVVSPRIVATLRPPLTVDNMEALAVERVNGRIRIWIASDDNFSGLFRTLLLQFELEE